MLIRDYVLNAGVSTITIKGSKKEAGNSSFTYYIEGYKIHPSFAGFRHEH
jgi:hypothetical protein